MDRIVTCIQCGRRAGAGSTYKRGLCLECQMRRRERKGYLVDVLDPSNLLR